MRRGLVFFVKLGLVVALLGWLARSGGINVGALRILTTSPRILAITIVVWAASPWLAGAFRWWLLLRAVDVPASFGRALRLQLVALFANVVVPGGIGGDVLKNVSLMASEGRERRGELLMLPMAERFVGLFGLLLAGLLVLPLRAQALLGDARLRPLVLACVALTAIGAAAVFAFAILARIYGDRLAVGLARGRLHFLAPGARGLGQLAGRGWVLAQTTALSVGIQIAGGTCLCAVTRALYPSTDPLLPLVLWPFGMLSFVLPLSIAGFGIGHLAFGALYALAGLPGEATAFNVYLVSQTALSLLGVVPYLFLPRIGERAHPA